MRQQGQVMRSHLPLLPSRAAAQGIETHTLSVIVDNEPGVLARSSACSPGAATTSTRSRCRRPRREAPVAHHHRDARHADGDRADPRTSSAAWCRSTRRRHDHRRPGDRARAGDGEGARHRRAPGRGATAGRAFRARVIDAAPKLHLRNHRREREDRAVHRSCAAGSGRGVPQDRVVAIGRGAEAMRRLSCPAFVPGIHVLLSTPLNKDAGWPGRARP